LAGEILGVESEGWKMKRRSRRAGKTGKKGLAQSSEKWGRYLLPKALGEIHQ